MRYNVHPLRAVRHRIARHIGVLVGAVLVTVLGLPSAAQAQKIDTVVYTNNDGFTVNWMVNDRATEPTSWLVTFTKPNSTKEVVPATGNETSANLNQNDEGTWWIQVDACYGVVEDNVCPADALESGDSVGYTHGPLAAPKNLTASLVPGGVALTWTSAKADHGHDFYEIRQDEGEDEGDWAMTTADGAMVVQVDPGDYTFMVRSAGKSDNSTSTTGMGPAKGAAASVEVTVPMAAPTLPEIAALFLALLLLGSGAYLIRRRGTLTPA